LRVIAAWIAQNGVTTGDAPDLAPAPPATARCGRTAADPGPGDPLARLEYAMVGDWRGSATSPWGAWSVAIRFSADGTYDARTTDDGNLGYAVTPFYYDQDPEHDRRELVDVDSNGDGSGNLYLEWLTSPDDLQAIHLDDTLSHLHFEYFHFGYGPIVYELDCQ
jgi:hypothetical protein